jgi:hypothetical protein
LPITALTIVVPFNWWAELRRNKSERNQLSCVYGSTVLRPCRGGGYLSHAYTASDSFLSSRLASYQWRLFGPSLSE